MARNTLAALRTSLALRRSAISRRSRRFSSTTMVGVPGPVLGRPRPAEPRSAASPDSSPTAPRRDARPWTCSCAPAAPQRESATPAHASQVQTSSAPASHPELEDGTKIRPIQVRILRAEARDEASRRVRSTEEVQRRHLRIDCPGRPFEEHQGLNCLSMNIGILAESPDSCGLSFS